jgi:thiamine-phosphate pyrophosphorylase
MSTHVSTRDQRLARLQSARLYAIVDTGYTLRENVCAMTRALIKGGADILQLRAKKLPPDRIESLARQMLPLTRAHGVPLVINDHPAIAAAIGADIVHVGQDDDAIANARAIVGPDILVGKSTHSPAQAAAAQQEGADYIGFGPLFATGTKPDYTPIGLADISDVHQQVGIPIFCIGGVNAARLDEVLAAGAQRIVVVSDLLLAADVRAQTAGIRAWMKA